MTSRLSHLARTIVRLQFATFTLLGLATSLAVAHSSKEFSYDAGLHVLDVPSVNGFLQVDGLFYPNLAAATKAIPTGGRLSIFDALSENDTNGNPITVNPFPNDKAVDVRLGGGVIINTSVPLVLGNGSTLTGSGRVLGTAFGNASGTLIAPSTNFPIPLTQPAAPTLTCHSGGGNLPSGTYKIILTQINNINTYNPGSGRQNTAGETIGTGNEATTGTGCQIGSNFSITFTAPSTQVPGGNTTFQSVGTKVYITSGASGAEIFEDASVAANISCTAASGFSGPCADGEVARAKRIPC